MTIRYDTRLRLSASACWAKGLGLGLLLSLCGNVLAAEPPANLRLYEFDCGRIRLPTLQGFGVRDDETDVREVSVACYVIEHERGRLLFDGGVMSSFAAQPGWSDYQGMAVRLDRSFAAQLQPMGLDMSSFDYVAFSHLHWDHIGVANEVRDATLIIQQPEFAGGFPVEGDPTPGFEPALYANLANLQQMVVDGDHDVFGDGSVRLLATPGHTPGHQSLWVNLKNTGPVILSGDLYHLRLSREQRRVPEFNYDVEATRASMDKIEALVTQTGADLWIEHELARFERGKQAPQYYD